jgi:predicted neuraminidase
MEIGPIYDLIPGVPSCHCSTVQTLPDGRLIMAFFAGQYEKAQDVAIYSCYGDATGTKWTEPQVIADTPNRSEGSPVFYLAPDNTLHLFFLTMYHGRIIKGGWSVCTVKHQISKDLGSTWSQPIFLRKRWFWVLRNRPIRLQNGNVVLPVHYEAGKMHSFFYVNPMPDLSGKWIKSAKLNTPKGCDEPAVCELKDGSLLCSLRTHDKLVFFSRSYDRGLTWSKPVASKFSNPNSQTALLRTSSDKVVMALNSGKDRLSLSYVVSDDGGETWSGEEIIDKHDPKSGLQGEFSYPCLEELSNGEILVTYTHLRSQIYWGRFKV